MLHIYRFQKKGVVAGSVRDLSKQVKCWADCVNPTKKELEYLSHNTKIPIKEFQEVLDKDERPKVKDNDHYSLIVVRAPFYERNNVRTTPLSIFISKHKNYAITIAIKELESLDKIRSLTKEGKIDLNKESMSYFTYRFLDETFESYFSILEIIEDNIDRIEHMVVKKPDKITVENIFSVKKTLIFFNKALTANREVIASIEKEYLKHIDKKNVKRFSALYNEVTQLLDMVGTHRDILTGTLDIYISSVSNNLNQVMKTLTIIASFVLVPTLISGIYGMNFSSSSPFNMPELTWKYGYFFSLGLMALSVIITFIYFKRKGWM